MAEFVPPDGGAQPIDTMTHGGRVLPVFETVDVVWNPYQLEKAATCRVDTVRYARVASTLGHFTLDRLLQAADDTFDAIARECESEVIPHAWGLAQTHEDVYRYYAGEPCYEHPDLPKGMSLVAQVPILVGLQSAYYSPNFRKIEQAVNRAFYNPPGPHHWVDAKSSAFGFTGGRTVLFDIEPIIIPSEG